MLALLATFACSIPSSGRATFTTTVNVRASPSTSSAVVAQYSAGQSVTYDSIYSNEGRTWISYIGGSGNRRYCCAIDTNGAQYITVGGGGSPSPSLPYLQRQSSHSSVRQWGCLFCACCWVGGLNTIGEVDAAFTWARNNNYVRWDAYVLIGSQDLSQRIANHYGRTKKSGCVIVHGNGHFYVTDTSGREIYNSAGWGWGH
ncbi:YSIRK-type signal peptide-containing protein [Histomonas meleagridis]|uniref:YSIRK-type signal peptide-containing protein n=1 Tax=Histomonas meleagridis TaxID=135588 RepID=UPI00355A6F2B|nr:YSIRK-type signal peptide-containing protein [Histomonas meleagridis]KAH0802265.1 YSIRK-type signal peptide-containing protein [Histomonas meleagridis]